MDYYNYPGKQLKDPNWYTKEAQEARSKAKSRRSFNERMRIKSRDAFCSDMVQITITADDEIIFKSQSIN